ncbi:HEAT repeat domain-containing protein [Armatimonas sp.]|uniref:HEAT repeat domain-containing protein n=1 Tax=Armatimonas sp. TaxID=1872638 RepID=UPI00286BA2DB|nr:HEAT repeat domain-containing protein [Armatimonas sp.]
MNDDPLPELLAQLREKGTGYDQNQVRDAIVVLVGQRAVEPLIRLLDDKTANVSWEACRTLGLLWDRRAVTPIAARLDKFGWEGPQALGRLGGARASEALLQSLETHKYLRIATVRALGALREKRAIPALIKLLPVGHGHLFASEGIGDLDLGDNAANSLAQIGKPAREALLEPLQHKDPYVRERAATALVGAKNPRATPQLLKQLNDDTLPAVAAAYALAALKEKRAIPALLRWLERAKTSPFARTAVGCLGVIGDPSTFSVLAHIADGPDRELASAATYALGGLHCDESFRYLAKCPRDRVLQAYYALGDQKDPRAFALLTERLKFSDNEEAMVLAVALQNLGDPRAIPHLMKRAQQPGDNITYDIFPAVARISTGGTKMIAGFLTSTDEVCSRNALEALSLARKKEALPYLRPLLKHPDVEVHREAISAMANIFYTHKMTGP